MNPRVAPAAEVPPFRWRDILDGHALLFLVVVVAVYGVLVVGLARVMLTPTGKDDQYIVLLPPWVELDRIFEISDALKGRVVGLNPRLSAYQLYVKRDDAVDALYRAGAWLVLDPQKVGGILGCGPPRPRQGAPMPGAATRDGIVPAS